MKYLKHTLAICGAGLLAIFILGSTPSFADNQRFFLKTKITRVPGASLVESCRIRLRVKIRRAAAGPGNIVICTVPWGSGNANSQKRNPYSGKHHGAWPKRF